MSAAAHAAYAPVQFFPLARDGDKDGIHAFRASEMGWHSFTVAEAAGETIAAHMLSRANNPTTWSFESLGGLVFRQRREEGERFYFCPRASRVFQPLIATHGGQPCDSPLIRALLQTRSSRLVLGFRTNWEVMKQPTRKTRAHGGFEGRR